MVLIGLLTRMAQAADINVPADHPTIQAAIVAANPGDVVIVAPGTYPEIIDFLGKAITVRSTDPTDPTVVMQTIISGFSAGHIVQCVSGEGVDTVLSGLVITGGNANAAGNGALGGGMFNLSSSPTVINCTFSGNSANVHGGGMYNNDSSPTVTNCLFSGNSAGTNGGGMYNANTSNPTVTNCTFSGNIASSQGGGMFNTESNPTVIDCLFSVNSAEANSAGGIGGGILNTFNSSPMVTNCVFRGNWSTGLGGGIYSSDSSTPILTNNSFCDNRPDFIAGDGGYVDGGGNALELYCPPPIPISVEPSGGCCVDGNCLDLMTESNCLAFGGTFFGDGSMCATSDCTNNWCYAATPIALGNTPFNTIGATTDGPINPGCDQGDGTKFVNDIWFEYTASSSGTLTVLTCGQATFDTIIAAYTGLCGSLNLVNCDDEGCGFQTSIMNFDVTAGETYLLRVGGWFGSGFGWAGTGTLSLSLVTCPPDINNDGNVNVTDLLALLAAWGLCP